jgi:hypothetical protein
MPPVLTSDLTASRVRGGLLVVVCAAVALLVAMAAPSRASAARAQCPGSFRVLHDDRVGRLRIPAGSYEIFLLQRSGLSCPQASRLLTRFLASPSGRLPAPWIVQPQTASFRRGPGGSGFRIDPAG